MFHGFSLPKGDASSAFCFKLLCLIFVLGGKNIFRVFSFLFLRLFHAILKEACVSKVFFREIGATIM
jgi:hypothetical protein